jgi:hypothetical protein
MKTKTKNIVAILMATIIAMAMFAPAAMATPVEVNVPNAPPQVICKCEDPNPVTPNMNLNEPVTVTICAVVCDPNGKGDITSVTANVYMPDGTPLYTGLIMGDVDTCDCQPLKPEVSGSPVYCDRPINEDPTCQLYEGTFQMDITQPGGEYRVVVTATDSGDLVDTLQNRFFFESLVLLDIEFDVISFVGIEIGVTSYVSPGYIHNCGNDPIQIGYTLSGFGVDTIVFDVDEVILIPGVLYWNGILENYCNKIYPTFSLLVNVGTPPGVYSGNLEITAREAPHTVLLENKKTDDIDLYDPILDDGKYGKLTYDLDTCEFTFKGYGLGGGEYCLIYYPEPWPGTGGCCFGPLDANGELSGLLQCIPNAGDYDYDRAGKKLAKIWLVPCVDYTDGLGLNKWNPSEILFDMETICCGPCCPQPD